MANNAHSANTDPNPPCGPCFSPSADSFRYFPPPSIEQDESGDSKQTGSFSDISDLLRHEEPCRGRGLLFQLCGPFVKTLLLIADDFCCPSRCLSTCKTLGRRRMSEFSGILGPAYRQLTRSSSFPVQSSCRSPQAVVNGYSIEASVYDLQCFLTAFHGWICSFNIRADDSLPFYFFRERECRGREGLTDRYLFLKDLIRQLRRTNYFVKKCLEDLEALTPSGFDFSRFAFYLDVRDLIIEQRIAETHYAQVNEGIWRGERVAVKTYIDGYHDLCEQEASVRVRLQHPNIVRFIGVVKDERGNASSVVMELMSRSLQDEIDDRRQEGRPFTVLEEINVMIQISRGMSYLHSQGFMHRDLKPANVLICSCKSSERVGKTSSLPVKIADFGDAKTVGSGLATPNVGTLRWMVPEVYSFNTQNPSMKNYTYKADVYSFSILCSQILSGELPFKGISAAEYYSSIATGQRPKLPSACPEGLVRLIKRCWEGDARERPDSETVSECLRCLREQQIFGEFVNGPFSDILTDPFTPTDEFKAEYRRKAAIARQIIGN